MNNSLEDHASDSKPSEIPQMKRASEIPQNFDENAKKNIEEISRIHEFRRANIKEMEPNQKDFFDYSKEEESRRYDALKLETLFRFESTYKALKWGVMVGGMFAFHRYYRTRNINNAAHWFTVMSSISFFNIWLSYSAQEFVTEYGSRKSISMSSRNEYHQNAYKHYVERVQAETLTVDYAGSPML